MRDLTLQDPTQYSIVKQLAITEQLLGQAATIESGTEQSAEIWGMPDLGLANNVRRMHGGFFTGAIYTWSTTVPIVPIDATVNCCGVSVFKVNTCIETREHFNWLIDKAIERTKEQSSYTWNFASGNHFITYGEVKYSSVLPEGRYVVLHSSAAEFKSQNNGLYPMEGNWYSDQIKVLYDKHGPRYIRYIAGRTAERFIRMVRLLEEFNRLRHQYFAGLLFGENAIEQEILNEQHYGMPTTNSVAIGCQWLRKPMVFLLLTAPARPLFFVEALPGHLNQAVIDDTTLILQPHGLGKEAIGSLQIVYRPKTLVINNQEYPLDASLKGAKEFHIRNIPSTNGTDVLPHLIEAILSRCPGKVVGQLQPIYSYCASTKK